MLCSWANKTTNLVQVPWCSAALSGGRYGKITKDGKMYDFSDDVLDRTFSEKQPHEGRWWTSDSFESCESL